MCCEKCLETIGRVNTKSARLWVDLCSVSSSKSKQILNVRTVDFNELRHLEMLGFVVSYEKPPHLVIRINGHYEDPDFGDFFCINLEDHDEDE